MRSVLGAALLLGLLASAPALAGNDDGVLLGDEAALLGGAVTATVTSGSALFYNPSGLAFLADDRFDANASAFALRHLTFPGALRNPDATKPSATQLSLMAIPSALSLSRRFGARFVAAAGVFVPQFVQDDFEVELTAQAAGRQTRWALGAREATQSYRFVIGGGLLISPSFALGASLALAYEHSQTSVLLAGVESFGGEVDLLTISQIAARRSLGLEARLGAQLRLGRWQIGLAFRAPALYFAHSTRSLTTSVFHVGGTPSAEIESDDQLSLSGVELLTPARLRWGLAYRRGSWLLSGDADLRLPISNADAILSLGLDWNARIGLCREISSSWTVGGGLFTDRDAARRRDGDGEDFYGGVFTVSYTNQRRLHASEKHSQLLFTTTLGLRYAYGYGHRSGFAVATDIEPNAVIEPTKLIETSAHELSLHVGSTLHF